MSTEEREKDGPERQAMNRRGVIVRIGSQRVAFVLDAVLEVFRPSEIRPFGALPPVVRGMCRHRGHWSPVIDLAVAFGEQVSTGRQCVALRVGDRQAALLVDRVEGVRPMPAAVREAPRLLQEASSESVRALGLLEDELLVVLETARLVPPEVWARIDEEERAGL